LAYILNTSSNLDGYVKAACRPSADEPNRLLEIISNTQFKAGRTISNPDRSITVVKDYAENVFSFSQFDLQNDGLIIAIDWKPGAHTNQYEGSHDYRLISIRNQAEENGNTVEMISNDTSGYTNNFFVSRSSSTVKDSEVLPTPPSQTRQVSYIHYKPGTRVFSFVNDGTEQDTYTLPAGAFNIDRVIFAGGRPDDRIFGWVMLHKVSSDFSVSETTELEDRFQHLFSSNKKYYRQLRLR